MEILLKYFKDLSPSQIDTFRAIGPLYAEWNDKINVVSRKDIDQLYERHILHSLGIAKVNAFKPGTRILDVGTGGGFPGVPLAILFPECEFHLVDSIGKKIKVVDEVCAGAGIKNVRTTHGRAEDVKDTYHFVVSRAVTRLKPFWSWIDKKFDSTQFNQLGNGVLYLKGGDLAEELQEFNKPAYEYDLSMFFEEDFFETKKVIHVPAF